MVREHRLLSARSVQLNMYHIDLDCRQVGNRLTGRPARAREWMCAMCGVSNRMVGKKIIRYCDTALGV